MPAAAPPPADLPIILPTAEMIEIGDALYNEGLTKRLLGDKNWRLDNLYWIKPEGGGDPVRFKPREIQKIIYIVVQVVIVCFNVFHRINFFLYFFRHTC